MVQLFIELGVAVAAVVVEGQYFLVPQVYFGKGVAALVLGDDLVDLLHDFLRDVVVGEDGVHFDELGDALPVVAELADVLLGQEGEDHHLVEVQPEVLEVVLD